MAAIVLIVHMESQTIWTFFSRTRSDSNIQLTERVEYTTKMDASTCVFSSVILCQLKYLSQPFNIALLTFEMLFNYQFRIEQACTIAEFIQYQGII